MAITRIIDDGLILAASRNVGLLDQFPFLRPPAPAVSCCGRKARQRAISFNTAKSAIHGLPADQQRKLLAAMGLTRGRLIYSSGQSVVDVIVPSS